MTEPSKKNAGTLIVAVIALGALYVAYSMYVQFDEHSNNQFDSARQSFQSTGAGASDKGALKTNDNPFQAALLATDANAMQTGPSEHMIHLLQQKVGALDVGILLSPTLFPNPQAAKIVSEIAALDKAAGNNEAGSQATVEGLAKVKEGLAYCHSHPDLSRTVEMNILLLAVKLAYKAKDLDQARSYLQDAVALARHFQDYKMDTFAAFDCLLSGNIDVAARYEPLINQYDAELAATHYDKLPALAAQLVAVTKDLPKDSFYALNARLANACALYLGQKKGPEAQVMVKALAKDAADCGDIRIAAASGGLYQYFGQALQINPHRYKQFLPARPLGGAGQAGQTAQPGH